MAEQIPRDFIDLLLSRTEIVDLIDGRVSLRKKSGSNYFACCPFHQEKNPSFSVSQTKQFYYCFGCGAHGNAVDFLMQYDRLSFPESIEALARLCGMEVPRQANHAYTKEKSASQKNLYELLDQVSTFYQAQLRSAPRVIEYVKQRGISGEIAKQFGIGYAPPGWDNVVSALGETHKASLFETGMLIKKDEGGFYDRFRDRVMFPIIDRRGRVVGFGGRIIDKGEPKYLNSPETPLFQKGHELYGLYQTQQAHRQLNRIIVVEGYMDVIALFQQGVDYAVATLGTATSKHHIERLFKATAEIIFCFDGDQAGRSAAWRALEVTLPLMRDGVQVRFMFLPEGEDPDSLVRQVGKEGFEALIHESLTISQFFFQTLAQQTDLTSTDGRARYVKLATDLLKQLPAGIFQQMMMEELAKRARIDVSHLRQAHPAPKSQPTGLQAKRQPTALRLVLALLVQQPQLVEHILEPLPKLSIPGYDLLLAVIDLARLNPQITTGQLLEHWRDKEDAGTLAKLAQWEHEIPELGIQHEFIGSVKKLHLTAKENSIDKLLAKAAQGALSLEEKQMLSELINQKR